jgi:fatty acid desaturase
MAGGTDAQ